jgi:ParB family chromosome partitioning protein
MSTQKKRGLGRGLDSLFDDNSTAESFSVTLRLSEIEPNRSQPRREFDPQALEELADSIRQHGLLQPITVRPVGGSGYQIVAGERRWRACRMVGLDEVPVIIREMSDAECMELALIENLQREDLNPVEEAAGYRVLADEYGLSQEQIAESVGKSRPAVANAMRLLSLPEDLLSLVSDGSITAGHGRALLAIEDDGLRAEAARLAVGGATVRQIERIAKGKPAQKPEKKARPADSYYKEVELALTTELGRKVRVSADGSKGTLQIEFYNKQELADMAYRLAGHKN